MGVVVVLADCLTNRFESYVDGSNSVPGLCATFVCNLM